jgi:hypothetical protein
MHKRAGKRFPAFAFLIGLEFSVRRQFALADVAIRHP